MSNPAWNNQNVANCGGDNSAWIGGCLAGQNGGLPSCAIINYGDSVVLWDSWSQYGDSNSDQNNGPNGFVGTNVNNIWSYISTNPGSAQAFQIFCANNQLNPVPMTTAGTPDSVKYGDKVIFWANGFAISYSTHHLAAFQISLAELQAPIATNTWNSIVWTLNVQPLQTKWGFGPPWSMGSCIYANYFSSFTGGASQAFNPSSGQGRPANLMFIQSLGNPTEYWSSIDSSNSHCGTAPCWDTEPFGHSPTPSIITMFLTTPTGTACNFNTDCNDPSGGTFCINNKCYSDSQTVFPPLGLSAISSSCQAGFGTGSSNNNMTSAACQGFCTSAYNQCTVGTNSSACTDAASCDTQMTTYCSQTYGNTVPQAVNGIANPCTCISAALQVDSAGNPINTAPQCFYPGCAGCPAGVYCTTKMQTDYTPAQCQGECGVVVNCQNSGSCIVDGNQICLYCANTAPAGSCGGSGGGGGGGNGPAGNIISWVKGHVLEASLIGGGVALLVIVLLSLVLFRKRKPSAQ